MAIIRVPIESNLIEPGSITFNQQVEPRYWTPAPSPSLNLNMSYGVVQVYDIGNDYVAYGYSYHSIKITNGDYFKLNGVLNPNMSKKINAGFTTNISGSLTYSIELQLPMGESSNISEDISVLSTGDFYFGFYYPNGNWNNFTITFDSLELYKTTEIDNPSNFNISLGTINLVNLSWSLYNDEYVMIAYSNDGTFGTPSNNYNVDDEIDGGGTVIYIGNSTSTTNNINNGETRYYKIWTKKFGSDLNWYYSDGIEEELIGNPQSFSGSAFPSQIQLSWTLNLNNNNILLVSGNTIGTPSDDSTYVVGDIIPGGGEVLYVGSSLSLLDENLLSNTTYNYKLFSVSSSNIYSPGLELSISTLNSIIDPTNFNINKITNNQIYCTWELNVNNDYVLLSSGTTTDFGTSPSGSYSIGDSLGNGDSTILLNGTTNVENYVAYNTLSTPYTIYFKIWTRNYPSDSGDFYSNGEMLSLEIGTPTNIGGFNNGKFYGGYFSGDWYGGKWISGYFLSGATWHSSEPKPRT